MRKYVLNSLNFVIKMMTINMYSVHSRNPFSVSLDNYTTLSRTPTH